MKLTRVVILLFLLLAACSNNEFNNEGWIANDYSQEKMDLLQVEVNEGHRPGMLDPVQVAREFLTSMEEFEVDNSYPTNHVVDQETKHIYQYKLIDGRYVQLELIQPNETGNSGIYVVNRHRFTDHEGNRKE